MAAPKELAQKAYKYLFRNDLLKNKVAFVTGGGTGIGFTIAEILMRHECDCVIASRKIDKLKEAASELEKATGRRCLPIAMDVRKPDQVMSAVDQALGEFNRLDILVNNAAGNFPAPIASLSYNAFKTVMEIDAMGTFNVSKTVYEKYFRNHGGVIVNITATLQHRGQVLQAHAGAAKAGIDALTKHMAMEWGQDDVRVVGLAPGPIADTEGFRRLVAPRGGDFSQTMPLKRAGTRVEMGHAVLFLVSEAGGYITGETLVADGGNWLASPNDQGRIGQFMKRSKI